MAVMMLMEWDGVTSEQYEAARKLVNWEGDVAPGGILHVAAFTDTGLRTADVWDSVEAFQTFVNTRLMPGVQQLGIPASRGSRSTRSTPSSSRATCPGRRCSRLSSTG